MALQRPKAILTYIKAGSHRNLYAPNWFFSHNTALKTHGSLAVGFCLVLQKNLSLLLFYRIGGEGKVVRLGIGCLAEGDGAAFAGIEAEAVIGEEVLALQVDGMDIALCSDRDPVAIALHFGGAGHTREDRPVAWLGSTTTGRWDSSCRTGIADRSNVFRV